MKKHLKYLQKIDMFGNRIELSYYKEKTHKTKFGGFLTVLLVIFSILAINYFGQEIINKNTPNVTTEENYLKDFYIKDCFQNEQTDTLMIAIRVLDYQQKTQQNEQIYVSGLVYDVRQEDQSRVSGSKQTIQMDIQQRMRSIQMENIPCSNYTMYNDISNANEFDFESLLCYRIKKGQLEQNVGIVKFDLLINLKQTSTIQRGILEIYFTELALDVSQYEKPDIYYLSKRVFSFEKSIEQRLPINLKKVVLDTDKGSILTEYNSDVFIIPQLLQEIQQLTQYVDESKRDSIFSMEFQMDRKYLLTRRSYQKLQDFLSSVGGIIKVFSMVFIFLSKKLTKLDFYMNLLNQIFNFEDPNEGYSKYHIEEDSEEEDEININQNHQIQEVLNVENKNAYRSEFEQQQQISKHLQKFSNKSQKLQNDDISSVKQIDDIQKKFRKSSLEDDKNIQENIKSESQMPLKSAQFLQIKEQNTVNNFNTLQNTETLIPLQLLSNPNHHEQCPSPTHGNSEKSISDKKHSEEKENDRGEQGQLKINMQILQDIEDSDDQSRSLKKQIKRLQQSEKQNNVQLEFQQDEENPPQHHHHHYPNQENEHHVENDIEDNQKRNTHFRRRNAIPKNTHLISKFMHKVRSLLNNEEADAEKIETIKKKLNHQGNKYIQPENKPLKWGFFDYIQNLFWFGKARKKREQMKYCWKKVKERLNAVYIMQKLVELEKLKILLLDEHQLKLFDYLPKPMISLNVQSDDSSNTSPSNRVHTKKSNEPSKNISPINPVTTPINPQNTPISQLNLEIQQQFKNDSKDNTSGNSDTQNQGNENRQTGINEKDPISKSSSPLKKKKLISCFGQSEKPNSNKKDIKKSSSLNQRDVFKKQNTKQGVESPSTNNKHIQKNQNAFHQQWIQLNSRTTPLEKALYAMEAFEFIKNKQIKTAIDIKLVDMLDSRMKKCFEFENVYGNQNYEENIPDGSHNISQFRQFFDGDNTIREFLYPTDQIEGGRNNRRARTVGPAPTSPRNNNSAGNSLSNHFNNPSNNNSINQSFMPFNNLNNLLNANNVNTPLRRNLNLYNPYNYSQNNLNESQMDFSRFINEIQQQQIPQGSNFKSQNNTYLSNNSNNQLQVRSNAMLNRQRSFSPSGIMQAQMKKKFALQRQKSSMSIVSNSSNQGINNNYSNTLNPPQKTNLNQKPSIFLRRLQTYDSNINEEVHKNRYPDQNQHQQQSKSHFNYLQQQKQSQQSSFNQQYQISSGNSSKKKNYNAVGSELSSPQKFEMDGSSSNDSHVQQINMFNPSISNIRPSHIAHTQNINLNNKNINLSVIESDLNTIEEDIPQENNTPTTLSKNSHINDSQMRKLTSNSFFQQAINSMGISQTSPLKVTEALKKYSISIQTMQQDSTK